MLTRLGWFVLLYVGGVVVTGGVALLIRMALVR